MSESTYTVMPNSIEDREFGKFLLDEDGKVVVRTSGSVSGEISASGLKNEGRITIVSINSTSWTPLPAAALVGRNAMGIQNTSGVIIKYNYDPAISGFVGVIIAPSGERFMDITDNIVIYARSQSGTVEITVEEIS